QGRADVLMSRVRIPIRIVTSQSSWPGLSRPSTSFLTTTNKDVDARDKRGHDGGEGRHLIAAHRSTKKFLSLSGSVTAPPLAIEYSIASVASSVARASCGVASTQGLPSAR